MKNYYYTGTEIICTEIKSIGEGVGLEKDESYLSCSPSLIKQLGTEAREVVEGKDFELQYEIRPEGRNLDWNKTTKKVYDDMIEGGRYERQVTAILPVKAVEGVEEKPEVESAIENIRKELMMRLCYASGSNRGQLNPSYACNYLASLEYRINQLEKGKA